MTTVYLARPSLRLEARAKRAGLTKINIMRKKKINNPNVSLAIFILFIGVAMAITAFPVLARIITETKLLSTPIGGIALSSAAVDDVTYAQLL